MSSSPAKFVWLHESLGSPPLNSGGNSLAARSHVQTGKIKRRRGLGPSFAPSNSTSRIAQEGWRIAEQSRTIEENATDNYHAPVSVSAVGHIDASTITASSDPTRSPDSASQSDNSSLVDTKNVEIDAVHPPSQPTQPTIPPLRSIIRSRKWSSARDAIHRVPAPEPYPGISDACSTLPITVDEGVKRVLSFVRAIVFPTWVPHAEASLRSTLSVTEWNSMTRSLENESSAYALLAMYATLLAKKTKDVQDLQHSLRYKHQSLISLRKQLAQGNSNRDENIPAQRSPETSHASSPLLSASMTFLLGASIWTDSLAEAEMHLRALKQQYELNTMNGWTALSEPEVTNIIRALRFDVRLAMLKKKPTIFDMETHAPMLLRKTFERGDRFFDNVPGAPFKCKLDAYLSEPLKSLLSLSRRGFWLWKETHLHLKKDDLVVLTNWVMGHHFIIQGRLLGYFLETTSQLSRATSWFPSLATDTRVNLCLALGMLCVHNDATNWGASGHQSTVSLLEDLQEVLMEIKSAEIEISVDGSFNCETILLWTSFIGAISARRHKSKTLELWFSSRLVESMKKMELTKWEDVRSLLRLFLYFEEMTPFLSLWFAKKIEPYQV